MIESVQKRFTKKICYHCNISNTSYSHHLNILILKSLEYRRLEFDLMFMYKIIRRYVDLNLSDFFCLSKWIYDFFDLIYDLPFLSSIHKKANCIAMFWTVSPHSLGSCHFWVTCLPHKGGASRSVPCPKTQQANLLACSPQPPLNAEHQAGKL